MSKGLSKKTGFEIRTLLLGIFGILAVIVIILHLLCPDLTFFGIGF